MRILVGTTEIARQLYDFADGFRRLGHEVHTVTEWSNPCQNPDVEYNFRLRSSPFPSWLNEVRNPLVRLPRAAANRTWSSTRLLRFMTAYDVYLFQFGGSLLRDNRDYWFLKRLGKRIIAVFNGNDIRHWSAADPFMRRCGLECPTEFYREQELAVGRSTLPTKLRTLRMAETYADAVFSVQDQSQLAVRPYHHFYLPMNVQRYPHFIPRREVPRIVHAPSVRNVKGTETILGVLEKVRQEGIPFEFRLLEGVPNERVIEELSQADVLIDSLFAPNYGMLALEGMATGCAVAGGNSMSCERIPPNRPVLHVDSSNVHAQLRRLLQDSSLRAELAARGRPFAEKYHDHVQVARQMLEAVTRPGGTPCDHYPSFYARNYRLPPGVTLGDDLLRMTDRVIERWGLPADVELADLRARGLVGPRCAKGPGEA